MARKSNHILPSDARNYTDHDWTIFGDTAKPNTRQKLLALTIEAMVQNGPGGFNVKDVCDRIDAKHALINYYFRSKELLIAEASALTFRKSIAAYRDVVLAAPKDPEKRLRAFIRAEMDWFRKMGSWGLLVSYPIHSQESRELIEDNYGLELKKHFEFYLSMIGTLILDLRKGAVTDFNFDVSNYPRASLLANPGVVMDGISMAWSAHGLNVWIAGQQVGSNRVSTPKFSHKMLIDHHIEKMVKLAKGE
jgi:AcrR family transcriptional regulator